MTDKDCSSLELGLKHVLLWDKVQLLVIAL